MKLRILSTSEVEQALSMPLAIEAMETAFLSISSGKAVVPQRFGLHTDQGVTLLMPAYLPPENQESETQDSGDCAIKIVSVYEGNREKGIPTITGLVMVIDPTTGVPQALLDGATLTAIRTGAAGGLAAKLLSQESATRVALFGAGAQAKTQLQAVMAVRNITHVDLISRSEQTAQNLATEIASWENAPAVTATTDRKQTVQAANIVICATSATEPVFDGNDLQAGAHVTAVGSHQPSVREVDETTLKRSRVVVDSRSACEKEAGDLIIPNITPDAELGEIASGKITGRESESQITFFKSVGVAAQDATSAKMVLKQAEKLGLGQIVEI